MFEIQGQRIGKVDYFIKAWKQEQDYELHGRTPAIHSCQVREIIEQILAGDVQSVSGLMDVLGHESVTTTQKYLHPALKNIAGIVNERNLGRAAETVAA